ncbi:sensor histidine kinase [Mucilaginibacter gilvus]|uniref:Sensor histidine kinase n=1 Tax=Mucilaginibacter gilvus TaxID=2305909 RepID=A0A444MJH3_9SPHI|nr:histidine kinase [Mucilaginibacter gilvus]RWY48384.1 sensor histidine kinase [Mucilaginibacter gilvus]
MHISDNKLDYKALVRRFLLHLLFWVLIVTYFAWGFGFNLNYKKSFLNALFYLPGHMFIVYVSLYLLVPRYLITRKFLHFFGGLFLTVACCTAYARAMQLTLGAKSNPGDFTMTTGRAILPFFHVGGIAISIKLLSYWYKQKQQTIAAEQQRTIAELQLLKSQLHPHFLFNTLNNLYSHTLEQSPKAPEIVLKLSALLRFMIYESSDCIELEKEIMLMEHYISLEKLRYGERLDVSTVITGDTNLHQIAPLLLLPFLENAFKHGTSKQLDQCWISLTMSVDEGLLYFKLVNSVDREQEPGNYKTGGLGLQNVKRRLDLLYNGLYHLDMLMKDEVYVVNLEIKLSESPANEALEYAIAKKEAV